MLGRNCAKSKSSGHSECAQLQFRNRRRRYWFCGNIIEKPIPSRRKLWQWAIKPIIGAGSARSQLGEVQRYVRIAELVVRSVHRSNDRSERRDVEITRKFDGIAQWHDRFSERGLANPNGDPTRTNLPHSGADERHLARRHRCRGIGDRRSPARRRRSGADRALSRRLPRAAARGARERSSERRYRRRRN